MNYNPVFLPVARAEFLYATSWYEEQQKGLGQKFISEIDKTIDVILKEPKLFSKRKKEYREGVTSNFPFNIVFRIYEPGSQIIIVAIYHSKRNPKNKYSREKK